MGYVRFQSPTTNRRGVHVGVFGLANALVKQGILTTDEERFVRESNAWYDINFTNPSDIEPAVYDRELNPGAVAWFRTSSAHLIERAEGYLKILEAHDVACERVESRHPGRVIYEDQHQIVVVPT